MCRDFKMQHKGMNEYKVMMKLDKTALQSLKKSGGGKSESGRKQWSESGRQKGR